jgi:hypothetical protein
MKERRTKKASRAYIASTGGTARNRGNQETVCQRAELKIKNRGRMKISSGRAPRTNQENLVDYPRGRLQWFPTLRSASKPRSGDRKLSGQAGRRQGNGRAGK